jgi:2-methylisocitrate lyase-like PEP mutase family enzyme
MNHDVPMNSSTPITDRFRDLHSSGFFLIPNPYDVGSAKLLEAMGFLALATTSAGFAGTLGRLDMAISRDELVAHVAAITSSVSVPVNVDAEYCFANDLEGVAETIDLLANAGAAGISIEDWNPQTNQSDDPILAASRVKAASVAASARGVLLTARCDTLLHGETSFDAVLDRLRAYVEAGAHVIYAPGITKPDHIEAVVALGVPVNVLMMPGTPNADALRDLGVRRGSVGGSLAAFAHGAMVAAAQQLLDSGSFNASNVRAPKDLVAKAFAPR